MTIYISYNGSMERTRQVSGPEFVARIRAYAEKHDLDVVVREA